MSDLVPAGWYDISVPLNQSLAHYPADPIPPHIYRYHDRALGAPVTMSVIEMISHTGTHIDAPVHFFDDGDTISDMPLDVSVGPCRVLDLKCRDKIRVKDLEEHDIREGERILCKTRNSPTAYQGPVFPEDYFYFDLPAAEYLASKKIRLLGIDCITIGHQKEEGNLQDTHKALLSAGVYILEDCALDGVPAGEYELLCLPLLLYKGDAGPCRAILRPLK